MATQTASETRGTKRAVDNGYTNNIEDDGGGSQGDAIDHVSEEDDSELDPSVANDDPSRYYPNAPETEVKLPQLHHSRTHQLIVSRKPPNAHSTSTSKHAPAQQTAPAKAAAANLIAARNGAHHAARNAHAAERATVSGARLPKRRCSANQAAESTSYLTRVSSTGMRRTGAAIALL